MECSVGEHRFFIASQAIPVSSQANHYSSAQLASSVCTARQLFLCNKITFFGIIFKIHKESGGAASASEKTQPDERKMMWSLAGHKMGILRVELLKKKEKLTAYYVTQKIPATTRQLFFDFDFNSLADGESLRKFKFINATHSA